jgi:GxxExxY protein
MACRNCHPDRSSSGFLCEFIGFNVAPPHVEVHMDREALDRLTLSVIQAGIEVHRNLGPGLLERLYRECLVFELRARGLRVIVEQLIPIFYKGQRLNGHYRIDLLVDDTVIVEIKSMETVLPVHYAQVLTYLRLTNKPVGLLMNFNVSYLRQGVRRIVSGF